MSASKPSILQQGARWVRINIERHQRPPPSTLHHGRRSRQPPRRPLMFDGPEAAAVLALPLPPPAPPLLPPEPPPPPPPLFLPKLAPPPPLAPPRPLRQEAPWKCAATQSSASVHSALVPRLMVMASRPPRHQACTGGSQRWRRATTMLVSGFGWSQATPAHCDAACLRGTRGVWVCGIASEICSFLFHDPWVCAFLF